MIDKTVCLIVFGWVAHKIADWLFQNDWMQNKTNLKHPAGYVHASIHAISMYVAGFPWWAAIIIGITHLLIDTRKLVEWFMKITKKTNIPVVRLENDQTFHLVVIVIMAFICGRNY